ncbi:alpha/beta-hydrolase [Piromyces finnis]|uniref:sn-1-specific diacylglycerol lipase n=1 Tax=Piromyces finnis TaxID=1754191 RepID=A0A1Y1VPB0_9FUNG|nr:alpha/beta-hydrolase [Piromyces finnis]|eukprot:ORX61090.1 alpha/beta-hydrolase [Piromyces finnis]
MIFRKRSSIFSTETMSNNEEKGKEKENEDNNINENNENNENENDRKDLSTFLDRSFLSTDKFPFSLHLFSEQTQTIQDYLPLQFLLPSTDFLWSSQNSYQYLLPEKIASKVSNVSHASIFIINTISQLIITTCSLAKSGASASMGVSRNALVRAFSTAENMQKSKITSEPNSKENEKFYKAVSNYTNLGIKSVNYLFSCAEMITYATFHLTEKSLLFSLSWVEQFFSFIDKVFGDTDVSHDITTFISLFYEDISDFFEKQTNVISKFSGLIKFIKAFTIYASILIVMRNIIEEQRKKKLLYDGLIEIEKGYTETLIQEEENEALMQYLEDEVIPEYKASEKKKIESDKENKKKEEISEKMLNDNEKKNEELKPVKISFMKNYSFPDYLLSLDKNKNGKNNEVIDIVKDSLSKDKSCYLNIKDNKQYVNDLEEILEQSLYENESIKEMFNSFEYSKSSYIYQLCKSQSDELIENMNSEQEQKNRLKDLVYFVKFACGAYGKYNTKIIYNTNTNKEDEKLIRRLHPNDYSFSLHTKIPLKCILSSSYHYSSAKDGPSSDAPKLDYIIAVDHLTNSVVLTICGTIGISDLLSNLNCDYDNLHWNGKIYSVHKSIYESAKNFTKSSSIPRTVISKALEVHSTYRLILCGHSYGGAVAALLALLWSDPEEPNRTNNTSGIPPKRPIHAYVYGAPSCMSYELSLHCKPLITNIINHNDIIPYFSHGFMKDQKQCCKMIFSYLNNEIPKKRKSFIGGIISRAMNKQEEEEEENYEWINEVLTRSFNTLGKRSDTKKQNDDKWFTEIYGKCKKLMTSDKIYPPGYLFIIEETSETYTNPNNINDKNFKTEKENDLVPAIAIDIEPILENEASIIESDQDTITIYNTKKDKNKETQYDKYNKNHENKIDESNNNILNDESLNINVDIDTSNYSFEKINDSFNEFNKDIEKSFAIEKESDVFMNSSTSDIDNHKAILLSNDNTDSKIILDHQIIHLTNSSINQKSENVENNQSEKITRIKLYECQDIKKQFSDILISKNMFSENKPYTYEELVIALGKVVFGYSLY